MLSQRFHFLHLGLLWHECWETAFDIEYVAKPCQHPKDIASHIELQRQKVTTTIAGGGLNYAVKVNSLQQKNDVKGKIEAMAAMGLPWVGLERKVYWVFRTGLSVDQTCLDMISVLP